MAYIASESAFQAGSGVFVDTFTDGPDYTAGTSSQVTLSNVPASPNAVWVFFNGIAQHHSEYSVNGNVVSFTSIIPVNVNTIQVQVNTQLAVGVPGEATVDMGKLTSGAITSLQRKNAIINGNFDIWQRATSQTAVGYGSADRWSTYFAGTSATLSVSRQAFALGQTTVPNEPEWFARHTFVSGSDVATDIKQRQLIESVRTFAGKTVALSFYAKASAALDMTIEFSQQFGTGGSPSPSAAVHITPQKVSLTTSWAKYELTADIPSISGKLIGADDNSRLHLHFWFSAGSSNNTRSDTLGLQTGTIDIAQVQLEEGITSTNFERRSRGEELQLCQRFYQELYYEYQGIGICRAISATLAYSPVIHVPVPMRGLAAGTVTTPAGGAITDINLRPVDDSGTTVTTGAPTVYRNDNPTTSIAIEITATGFITGRYYGATFWGAIGVVQLDAEL